jgi:2-keto-3-deoxy-L-rhamnonate aldolase RhmA
MLVTRDVAIAQAAVAAGVDRIFVDLEMRGKRERQRGRRTVISGHTVADVEAVRHAVPDAELLARIDPPGEDTARQVRDVIAAGADVVMLPYFTSIDEVARFVAAVDRRARACLLLETAPALARLEGFLALEGVDEIHVGLNDLHVGLGVGFMYELLAGGLLDHVSSAVAASGRPIRFGFGGGALIDAPHPVSPGDVLREHMRLGSRMIILSKTFTGDATTLAELERVIDLRAEVGRIRSVIADARRRTAAEVEADRVRIHARIWAAAAEISRQSSGDQGAERWPNVRSI